MHDNKQEQRCNLLRYKDTTYYYDKSLHIIIHINWYNVLILLKSCLHKIFNSIFRITLNSIFSVWNSKYEHWH